VGDTVVNPRDGAVLVWVPAGEFTMGSDTGAEDEKPARKVTLGGYWMYKTEVTVAQYRKFCEATGALMPSKPAWGRQDTHPIVDVSWDDAVAYCQWAGVSLPTEAQWEKAARGADGREYPWGNVWDARRCVCSVSPADAESTAPVGSVPAGASPYGCLDMAGNVWEWCADWYADTYYEAAPARDPKGPAQGRWRVLRGGSWYVGFPELFRCASRGYYGYPDFRNNHCIGFRGARTS
jgi:formylglycine-generating enzyme required for sulfatase activity